MLNRSHLRHYQNDAIQFIKDKKGSGLFLPMGGGKTGSALSAYNDMLDNFEITRPLIIAPLRVANGVWERESKEWEHLKHLRFSTITGNLKSRMSALQTDADFYVINIENVAWLVDTLKSKWFFDGVILDESSKFKNPTSKRFRSLKKVLSKIKKITLLTGTPASNSYMDLWSQIFLLDNGTRLGKSISMYRNTYFESDYMGYNYSIRPESIDIIQNKIKDVVVHIPLEGNVELPDFIPIVIDIKMDNQLLKQYKLFRDEMVLAINSDENITAVSAGVLSNKLLQFSSGAIYKDESNEYEVIHDLKFTALDELLEDELANENILVFYNYKHELERLLKKYPHAETLAKDGSNIDKWNRGEIKMLLAHPASAGFGLNLQYGGSVVVWLGLTWSLEQYLQANARLHRSGQKNNVRCIHLAVGEIEYRLMKKLADKEVTQQSLLDAITHCDY